MKIKTGTLPVGVKLIPLKTHCDERGGFTEIFRQKWMMDTNFIQWNMVTSKPGTMRGVHVHIKHNDYLIILQGQMSLGLHDLRENSSTEGKTALLELAEEKLAVVFIPRGVAHGFYFHTPSLHVYSVTHYWDPTDELTCCWNDPELQIPWPAIPSKVSERDASAPLLKVLKDQLKPWQPISA